MARRCCSPSSTGGPNTRSARSSSSTGSSSCIAILFLPPGNSIGSRIIGPILDAFTSPPGGHLGPASSGRTCGRAWRPRSARRWRPGLSPAQLRAVRLDARRRPAPRPRRRRLAPGGRRHASRTSWSPACSTTPARATPGSGRASPTRLGQRGTARWVWRRSARLPGFGPALERLRTHAETSAALAAAAGCSRPDRGADPRPGRADRSGVRRAAPARGRGQLMAADGSPGSRSWRRSTAPSPPRRGRAGGPLRRGPPARRPDPGPDAPSSTGRWPCCCR